LVRQIEISCKRFKDCDPDGKPCKLVETILENLERGDEVWCGSGIIEKINWTDR